MILAPPALWHQICVLPIANLRRGLCRGTHAHGDRTEPPYGATRHERTFLHRREPPLRSFAELEKCGGNRGDRCSFHLLPHRISGLGQRAHLGGQLPLAISGRRTWIETDGVAALLSLAGRSGAKPYLPGNLGTGLPGTRGATGCGIREDCLG